MLQLRTDILNKLLPATSKDVNRPQLHGIYIRDVDNIREYFATNGHILLMEKTPIKEEDGVLPPSGIFLKLPRKLKKAFNSPRFIDLVRVEFKGEQAHITNHKEDLFCDVEFNFYDRIPLIVNETDINVKRNAWLPFNPQYLQIICDFLGVRALQEPYMHPDDLCFERSACKWTGENKLALAMPMRA